MFWKFYLYKIEALEIMDNSSSIYVEIKQFYH